MVSLLAVYECHHKKIKTKIEFIRKECSNKLNIKDQTIGNSYYRFHYTKVKKEKNTLPLVVLVTFPNDYGQNPNHHGSIDASTGQQPDVRMAINLDYVLYRQEISMSANEGLRPVQNLENVLTPNVFTTSNTNSQKTKKKCPSHPTILECSIS